MRNSFISELVRLAGQDDSVALVVGDLGYGVVEPFAEQFPERFFNSGVAEQNMMGLAAGLASEGMHVFVYSIGNFPIFRCAEQIRNDVCYHELSVTIVAVGGGLAYGNLGYSHHAVQDYAFMRVMPNMTILAPGDPNETKMCIEYALKTGGPTYLRLGKAGEKNYNFSTRPLECGEFENLIQVHDSKTAIICTGAVLQNVKVMLEVLGLPSVSLFTCPIWGMGATDRVKDFLATYEKVIAVEDHLEVGGFGSWLLEAADITQRSKIRLLGLNSTICGRVGSQSFLNETGGLNAQNLKALLLS